MDVDDIDVDSMNESVFLHQCHVSSTGRSGSSIVSQSHTKKLQASTIVIIQHISFVSRCLF